MSPFLVDIDEQEASSCQSLVCLGCFNDGEEARDLSHRPSELDDDQTPSTRVEAFATAGYAHAGAQYHRQYFCGNSFGSYGKNGAVCDYPCAGDSSEFCGGLWDNDIYHV